MTTKLYQNDVYIRDWATSVSDLTITEDNKTVLYLDSTAFFPEGGGQSCDKGIISFLRKGKEHCVDVIDVQEEGELVAHTVSGDVLPEKGEEVSCSLDWARRFDNMQRHCGEHILSGIFHERCGGINRGFHMGEDYMTIDISLEENPGNPAFRKPETIDDSIAAECELMANRVIWANEPVFVFRFDSREEAEKMPLRKKLAFDEDISIVCVGSPENASDCVACCGTHPSTAGQVGLIKIYKVENYKGMFRIFFEAGERAFRDYMTKHRMLTEISNRYSSSIEDFPSKIKSQEQKISELKNQLFTIKKAYLSKEQLKLDQLIASEASPVLFTLYDLSIDDAFTLSKEYMGKPVCCGRLILIYVPKSTSFILASDGTPDCGSLVKEYASFYKGKGGGNKTSARAIFSKEEDAMLFADLLSKHLK